MFYQVMSELASKFKVTDLGELTQILSMEVQYSNLVWDDLITPPSLSWQGELNRVPISFCTLFIHE